jgi:hypothetical protein
MLVSLLKRPFLGTDKRAFRCFRANKSSISTAIIASSQTFSRATTSTNNTMRLFPWATLFYSTTTITFLVDGLPFRTRGTNQQQEEADATVVKDGEIVIHLDTRSTNNRNAIVEQYFNDELEDFSDDQLQTELHNLAVNQTDFLRTTRRALHAQPELMYKEEKTSAYIQSVLREFKIAYTTGWAHNKHPHVHAGAGSYGIVADIGTGNPPCVLLRADMDALPIVERTVGIDDYVSRHENRMHACGHDGHTTMLLGAAAILKQMEHSIHGTVRLMFQPAEEGGAGAKRMREEGVLALEPKPQYAFGMHVWPTLPTGVVASRPGPLLAACERFEILIAGVGGHAAMPHLTVCTISVKNQSVFICIVM